MDLSNLDLNNPWLLGGGVLALLVFRSTTIPAWAAAALTWLAGLLSKKPAAPVPVPASDPVPVPAPVPPVPAPVPAPAHPILDRIRAVLPDLLHLLIASQSTPSLLSAAEQQVVGLVWHATPDVLPPADAPAPAPTVPAARV